MTNDDDLRFGDVSGGTDGGDKSENGTDILDLLLQGIVGLVMLYVFLAILQSLFDIPIPFI